MPFITRSNYSVKVDVYTWRNTSLFYAVHWSYHFGCVVKKKTNCSVPILKLGDDDEISVESTKRIKLQHCSSQRGGGSDLSYVLILYLKDKQAALVRASRCKQTGCLHVSSVLNCIMFSCKQSRFRNALWACEPFLHKGSKWLGGMAEGNILVTVFTMSQLRLQIRPNTFGRLTGDSVQSATTAWWMMCVLGPKSTTSVLHLKDFYIFLQSLQPLIHLRLTQWQEWPMQWIPISWSKYPFVDILNRNRTALREVTR